MYIMHCNTQKEVKLKVIHVVLSQRYGARIFLNVKCKCKVVPVLFLTEHHPMKAYWGVEV
jgi:hypothetical protein